MPISAGPDRASIPRVPDRYYIRKFFAQSSDLLLYLIFSYNCYAALRQSRPGPIGANRTPTILHLLEQKYLTMASPNYPSPPSTKHLTVTLSS